MSHLASVSQAWWTRRLTHHTLYSLSTIALAIAFGAVSMINLILGSVTVAGTTASIFGTVLSAAILVVALVQRRKLHLSVGLILVVIHLVIGVLNVWIGINRHNIVVILQEVPLFALFIAGFYRPQIARIATWVMIALVGSALIFGALGHTWTSSSVGPANILSTAIFTFICCEAGVIIQAWFDEKTTVDPLTGALNRSGFTEAALIELRRAERMGTPTSVAVIDIDNFKSVNDTFGHHAGDVLLRDLVSQWSSLTRTNDIVGRLGGDEFMLLFPNTRTQTAEAVMQRLHARSAHPWSWGITEVEDREGFAEVTKRADEAMYRSRRTE